MVTGTHGKTTTTSMLAWIFHVAGRRPDFLIGGVAENFGKSYGLGGGREFIIEGDEYDSAFFDKGPKFLHYRPDDLIITSLEFDHADIYADLAAIELQFRRLVNLGSAPRTHRLLGRKRQPCAESSRRHSARSKLTVSAATTCGSRAISNFAMAPRIFASREKAKNARALRLPLVGRHNVLNALATIAIADGRGVPREAIEEALRTFAAWPAACRFAAKQAASPSSTISRTIPPPFAPPSKPRAARWPRRRLWVAFEPRSNTMRRRIFEDDLAAALATADGAVLGPVNRAQLLSEAERLSPERVVKAVRAAGRTRGGAQSRRARSPNFSAANCARAI